MLTCSLNKGQGFIGVKGGMADIMSDVTFVIKEIYEQLDADNAEMFKKFVKEILVDVPFCSEEEIEAKTEELKKERDKNIKKLISKIDEIIEKFGDSE